MFGLGGELFGAGLSRRAARNLDISRPRTSDSSMGATCSLANSFSADTTVQTTEGDVPISEVEIGDTVLAYNEATGEIGEYPVTATINHTDEIIIHLTIDGELIETTPEHPFYTEHGGWVIAGELCSLRPHPHDKGQLSG